MKEASCTLSSESFLHPHQDHIDLFNFWDLDRRSHFRSSWHSFRNMGFLVLFLMIVKLTIGTIFESWALFFNFIFFEVSSFLVLLDDIHHVMPFLSIIPICIELSFGWTAGDCRTSELSRIESNFYELIERRVFSETEWNKLEKVVEIFISENPIVNALKFTVEIYCPFECHHFGSVFIVCNYFCYLNLSSLLWIYHVEQIVDKDLSLGIHISFQTVD